MREGKYKILWDYHSEGYQFADEEFESIDAAVKEAVSRSYSAGFLIVRVIDWEAKELPAKKIKK